ncbi:hypothetical protein ACFL4G_12705 [Thermodesulfobacteriota bacterium]
MRENLMRILFIISLISGLTLQTAWADTDACRILEKETKTEQPEESFLEPLALGDGVAIPRFIGEKSLIMPVPEKVVLAVKNPDKFFRLQFDNDDRCIAILASCK